MGQIEAAEAPMEPRTDQTYADTTMALTVMNTFQGYLQHADAKVSTLVVAHAGAAVAVIATPSSITGQHGVMTVSALALFVGAFLMSGHHLIQALRPRLTSSVPPSAFGLMGISIEPPRDPSAQRDAAWEMARIFAEIARVKHEHVSRAIPWTAAMLVIGLAGVITSALLG
jgi:hypothetical protein